MFGAEIKFHKGLFAVYAHDRKIGFTYVRLVHINATYASVSHV